MQAVADSFAAALQAEVAGPADEVSGSGNVAVASTFSSSVAPLLRRSQGLQFYRDGMYFLCVAYINRVITSEEYVARLIQLQTDAKELIAQDTETPSHMINLSVTNTESAAEILAELKKILASQEEKKEGDSDAGSVDSGAVSNGDSDGGGT